MAKRRYGNAGSNFSIRLDDELREELQRTADANGRSLNEEIRQRLQRSYRDEMRIHDFFGDPKTYFFFRLLHLSVRMLGQYGGHSGEKFWLEDPYQYAQVATAIKTMLHAIEPSGPRELSGESDPEVTGVLIAGAILESIKAAEDSWPKELLDVFELELEPTFEQGTEAGINQFLGDYIKRAPDNLFLAELRRRVQEGQQS